MELSLFRGTDQRISTVFFMTSLLPRVRYTIVYAPLALLLSPEARLMPRRVMDGRDMERVKGMISSLFIYIRGSCLREKE